MKYSIIIPVYNPPEEMYEQCLDSVQQTIEQYKGDAECIIVNDGSTEPYVAAMVQSVAEKPSFKYIYKENGGVSSARNAGIEHARGEWITFVDPDDYIEPCLLEYFDKIYAESNYDLIILGTIWENWGIMRPEGSYSRMVETGEMEDFIRNYIYDDTNYYNLGIAKYTVWGRFYKTSIIRSMHVRFRDDLRQEEDIFFNLEYLLHVKKLKVDNYPVYHYVKNMNGSTYKINQHRQGLCLLFMEKLFCYIDDNFPNNESFEKALSLRAVASTHDVMNAYFTHPDNHKPFSELRAELEEYLSHPVNERWIRQLKLSDGTNFRNKLEILLLMTNSYWLMLFIDPLKKKIKRRLKSLLGK